MSGPINSFRDIVAWQRGRILVREVYAASRRLPAEERFGLSLQMRRAAISVTSNIAEGYGRGSRMDYQRFLRVARGSLFELESQTIAALDLDYLEEPVVSRLQTCIDEVARPLSGLIRSLE
jgi:four helix bundle protein